MRSDARANRQDLVLAAGRLLHEQGAGMSLRSVAHAAGVGIGTLYRHFPTRRDLLTAVMDQVVGRIEEILRRFLDGDDAPEVRWRRLADELAGENLTTLLSAKGAVTPRDCPPIDLYEAAGERILTLTQSVVETARAAGLVGEDVTGDRYLGGLLTVTRPFLPELEEEMRDQRDWLLDVYLRGLRAA